MEAVGVVVGIIVKGKKFLVERRRLDNPIDSGIVCLPAGHVKPNESLEEALRREIIEELGIQVKEMKFVCKNFYVANNGENQHTYCYLITEYERGPICKVAQEIFWEENTNNMSLEVDRKTLRKMRDLKKNKKFLYTPTQTWYI